MKNKPAASDEVPSDSRPMQTNCQNEPAYPGVDTVVFSIRDPEQTVHNLTERCGIEHPHAIKYCGEFKGESQDGIQLDITDEELDAAEIATSHLLRIGLVQLLALEQKKLAKAEAERDEAKRKSTWIGDQRAIKLYRERAAQAESELATLRAELDVCAGKNARLVDNNEKLAKLVDEACDLGEAREAELATLREAVGERDSVEWERAYRGGQKAAIEYVENGAHWYLAQMMKRDLLRVRDMSPKHSVLAVDGQLGAAASVSEPAGSEERDRLIHTVANLGGKLAKSCYDLQSAESERDAKIEAIVARGNDYREMARQSRLQDNWSAADSLDGKASGFFAAARMLRAVGERDAPEPDGIGWCSSCDKIHEVARPKCPICDDWLIFAADDEPTQTDHPVKPPVSEPAGSETEGGK